MVPCKHFHASVATDVTNCDKSVVNWYRSMHQMLSCVPSRNEGVQSAKLLLCSDWVQSRCRNSMLDKYDNKENDSALCNYQSFSPQRSVKKTRWPLEDSDPNSQDSGYGASDNREEKRRCDGFQFAEPSGVPPRRMSVDSRSPVQSPMRSSPQQPRAAARSPFMRQSSGYESLVDDGFTELIDMETMEDTAHLPSGITSLLSGDLVGGASTMEYDVSTTPEFPRTVTNRLRRSLSLCDQDVFSRSLSKVRTCLFRSPGATSSTAMLLDPSEMKPVSSLRTPTFRGVETTSSPQSVSCKRPSELDSPGSDVRLKKFRASKSFCLKATSEATTMTPTTTRRSQKSAPLQRSMSETEASIKSAVLRSVTDSDLTGDFSKPCILPLAAGYHQDLKCITPTTLAALLRGEFNDRVGSCRIVDCRYPYEYDGGHIEGAMNLYSKDLIERHLFDPPNTVAPPKIQPDTDKRDILVFHCEFSCERGPNLSRLLRSLDRQRNKEHYPALHYPEVYLLHGGYERFYKEQKEFCTPQDYRPMKHPDHEEDLRQFRSKSKSWQGDKSRLSGQTVRTNLKRLGF
ncbi:PREDICTED: M-phase inducer phosphatase-like isoform X2 [Dinoponera quadriceps]|uniref:protein-tyrosine-phosphatase n=1 Tax=Dinoponera quadriceps TaxID=609295 RepID=A0A6P3XVD7_DINQU|nr:PREDICTED: M-phase inducer phosphatase-like isoform X2 [Dinoponera quadriceps]